MKIKVFGLLSLAFLASIFTGPISGQGGDKNPLLGNWTMISVEEDGIAPKKGDGGTLVTITATEMKIGKAGGYSYKIDPTKAPKQIDLTLGKLRILGIYEVKDDQLKICLGDPTSGLRATRFETKAKSENSTLMVFRRTK